MRTEGWEGEKARCEQKGNMIMKHTKLRQGTDRQQKKST